MPAPAQVRRLKPSTISPGSCPRKRASS